MRIETFLGRAALVALALGVLYRLHPFVMEPDRIARFFVTEDGYLMLTVARNLAIGNGLSVAAGEVATNGVQPLATFVFALPYLLTGGDKMAGLAGVLGLSVLVAALGALAVRNFARRALAPQVEGETWPLVVAALFFTGPLLVFHSMNGLETGIYTLVLLAAALRFGTLLARGGMFPLADRLSFGLLLGLVFLARNDGAFFVAAVLGLRFLEAQISGGLSFREALLEAVPAGLVSLAVAAPWLIYNATQFGSIVPISGQSQSLAAGFASNLALAPLKIFETMVPMLPVPASAEGSAALSAGLGALAAAVLGVFLVRAMRRGGPFRLVLAAYALHGLALFVYYAFFFGAPWFLSRYFAPLAPLLLVAVVSVGLDLARSAGPRGAALAPVAGLAGLGLGVALLLRLLLPGVHVQGHFQVVDWVERHVAEETWMGAVQTGTLGYWHDRTINLDGKVNPGALAALRARGDVLDYVVESRIDYLADWTGLAGWVERGNARFAAAFEVLVDDPARNLSVLRRRTAPPPL